MPTTFAKVLRHLRTKHMEMNQETFAKVIDVSVSTLYKLETHKLDPSAYTLDRIKDSIRGMNEGKWHGQERKLVGDAAGLWYLAVTGQAVPLGMCPFFLQCLRDAIGQRNWVMVSLNVGKRLPSSFHHTRKGNLSNFWVTDILDNVVQTVPHDVMMAIARELECTFVYSAGKWSYVVSPSNIGYWIEDEIV